MKTNLEKLAQRKAKHNHPAYSKMAYLVGVGQQICGEGSYVQDQDGRKILTFFDQYGNQSMGYSHPYLVDRLQDKLASNNINSTKIFYEEELIDLAERLSALTNDELQYAYFSNGGGESIDNALKLARAATRRPNFVTTEGCFHGKTWAALSAASRKEHIEIFSPLMDNFHVVAFNDINAMRNVIDSNTAAVLLEPVQAENGVIVPSPDYLKQLRELCDEFGVVLIFDEMQLAFGRTGTFFGFEQFGVMPDIICIGKAFGGGIVSISAVIARKSLWDLLASNPTTFGSSLGGNPLSIRGGMAMLDLTCQPEHFQAVNRIGGLIGELLATIAERYPDLIVETRGLGMMYGIELKDASLAGLLLSVLYDLGLTSTYSLYNPKVVRIQPPMNISEEDVRLGMSLFDEGLRLVDEYRKEYPTNYANSNIVWQWETNSDFELVVDLAHNYPHYFDPFAKNYKTNSDVSTAFSGQIGKQAMNWENKMTVEGNTTFSTLVSSWLWNSLNRKTQIIRTDINQAIVKVEIDWDAGVYAYERFLATRIAYYARNQLQLRAEQFDTLVSEQRKDVAEYI